MKNLMTETRQIKTSPSYILLKLANSNNPNQGADIIFVGIESDYY
jgi:hypothetical protein